MSDDALQSRMRPSGGFRTLRSFRTATLIYDGTVSFTERFIDKRSRLVDQMVQAARSGRQNIAEGSRASATSSQTELRLVNVARASLEELLLDYEDFLRQRGKRQWAKDDAEARAVREVGRRPGDRTDRSDPTDRTDYEHADHIAYAHWLDHADPAVVANAIICLIHQANYLLDQQICGLERAFINEGGYSECLAAARLQARSKREPASPAGRTGQAACAGQQRQSGPAGPATQASQAEEPPLRGWRQLAALREQSKNFPACPLCGKSMVLRTARQGRNAGSQFLGCSCYPACKGTAPI